MLQAWAQEQGTESRRVFLQQDVLVPWHLQTHWDGTDAGTRDSGGSGSRASGRGDSEAAGQETGDDEGDSDGLERDELGRRVYRRYCHVYREGELQNLCARYGLLWDGHCT